MTVKELSDKLLEFPADARVLITMDWTATENGPEGQWEDALGDISYSRRENAVHLLNEHFK